ncbi:MAG: type III pantothenate kinase [Cryomorphaceae bacterium]|jgi:type III pantothenate kinase
MRLLCDIGNTRLKWAVEESGEFIASGALANGDLAGLLLSLPKVHPSSVWVSCVGPEQQFEAFKQLCKEEFDLGVTRAKVSQSECGVSNGYQDQLKLGVDRWIAALGVRRIVERGAVIVIDAGTALTIDLLDQDNIYQGGAILPGATLMHDSLVARTQGIDSSLISSPPVVGKTSMECVNSGVHYGLVGAVDRVVKKMQKSLPRKAALLITGGDASFIKGHTKYKMLGVEHLVLIGLLAIADQLEL